MYNRFKKWCIIARAQFWLKCKKASKVHFRGLLINSLVAPLTGDPIQNNFQYKDTFPYLPEFYEKSSIDGKQRLIDSIFTENLIFKNKKVRTTRVNEAVSLITSINRSYRRLQKEKPGQKSGLSHELNLRVLNSNQFLEDLKKISDILNEAMIY